MTEVEDNITVMHNKVNHLKEVQGEIKSVLKELKKKDLNAIIVEAQTLLDDLNSWDEEMIQRKSQAYDDVENFENKFTAEYLFLMNHASSSIPRINQPSIERKAELDQQWQRLKADANSFINTRIPAFNKKLWSVGVGALSLD